MDAQKNRLGFSRDDYKGLPSTLCNGCGHDSLNSCIVSAVYELGIHPSQLIRLSGIGCSSKSPAYVINQSFAFNSVHGRMATIATGVACTNRTMTLIGYSGDGDTASIGMGNWIHAIRRNINIVYIMENNGTYGLTKGQFSATSKRGSFSRWGEENIYRSVDCCSLAIEAGASFVARGFVIDKNQLIALLKAAFSHPGFAFLDIISPCVTFMNHERTEKSYNYTRENRVLLHDLEFIPADVSPSQPAEVEISFPNGSRLALRKSEGGFSNPLDFEATRRRVKEIDDSNRIPTGLIYYRTGEPPLDQLLKLDERPLSALAESDLRLTPQQFSGLVAGFK